MRKGRRLLPVDPLDFNLGVENSAYSRPPLLLVCMFLVFTHLMSEISKCCKHIIWQHWNTDVCEETLPQTVPSMALPTALHFKLLGNALDRQKRIDGLQWCEKFEIYLLSVLNKWCKMLPLSMFWLLTVIRLCVEILIVFSLKQIIIKLVTPKLEWQLQRLFSFDFSTDSYWIGILENN